MENAKLCVAIVFGILSTAVLYWPMGYLIMFYWGQQMYCASRKERWSHVGAAIGAALIPIGAGSLVFVGIWKNL